MDSITKYASLKDIWDTSVSNIGETFPSENGHTSIFIYTHKYKLQKNKVKTIESFTKDKWTYENTNNKYRNISKLTKYIQETILSSNNMIFSKDIKQKHELWIDGNKKTNFTIESYECTLFNDGVFLFSLFTTSDDNVHNISTMLNRELRNPSCLYYDKKFNRFLSFDNILKDVDELKSIYCLNNQTTLISFNKYLSDEVFNKEIINIKDIDDGKSKYAKYITAVHCNIEDKLEEELVYGYPELQHETDVALNVLQLCTNNLATANDFIVADRKFEQDINYVRQCIKDYGIRLWTLWSGVPSLNSLAFLSINKGGRAIIHQCRGELYIIYILNIYIKHRLQNIDRNIIDDNFMQINKAKRNLENLLELKSKYFSEEIADSFQPIIIDKKIKTAIGIDNLLSNIEENTIKTNELVTENSSTAIALIVAIYALINTLIPFFTNSKIIQFSLLFLGIAGALLFWVKRNKLGKYIDYFLK